MIILISPAKNLDFETEPPVSTSSSCRFLEDSKALNDRLKSLKPVEIEKLMSISPALADLNFERNQSWKLPISKAKSKQALYAFNGEVYRGLDASSIDEKHLDYTQKHLRILSGLYGLVRPFDRILPYRLEMGTKLSINGYKNLYQFWGDKITDRLNKDLKLIKSKTVINLASNEYFKSVNPKLLKANLITCHFKDFKNGEYKALMAYAKFARGLMTRFIIDNEIEDPEALKAFNKEGYVYNPELSKEHELVFTRG